MPSALDVKIELRDDEATQQLGRDIALAARAGDVLALAGDLGSGKTSLARALLRHVSGDRMLEVPSPSYTLCQTYELSPVVRHFDLYRLGEIGELVELGLEDRIAETLTLVEWPDIAIEHLPVETVHIRLDLHNSGRIAYIKGKGGTADRIARSLAIRGFLDTHWKPGVERQFLLGDASARRYETASDGSVQRIVMDSPRQPDGPAVYQGEPYSKVARLAEDIVPFLAVDEMLREAGFAAPAVYASDAAQGLALIEHLGEGRLLNDSGEPITERYLAAARLLAALHAHKWAFDHHLTDSLGRSLHHMVPAYDRNAMMIETSLFADWYAPYRLGRELDGSQRAEFNTIWDALIARISGSEKNLILRDYHSPNLIWREGLPFPHNLGLIDFQDAVIGPAAYDLASLGQDARVEIPGELETAIINAYLEHTGMDAPARAQFFEHYAIMATQRATKIMGIFIRLNIRDGKPVYMDHLPRIEAYFTRNLGHDVFSRLKNWYDDLISS